MCLLRFGGQTPAVDTPAAPGPAYTPEPEDSPEPNNTPEPEPSPGPEPTPAPTPEPTPEPDPGLPAGRLVTVDGLDLASGSVVQNGVEYVRLSELAEALAVEPESTEAGQITFPWRKQTVSLALDQVELSYGELSFDMAQPVIRYREELWVPVEDLCRALDISLLDDEEMGHLYCTPGAGAWALEEDRRVWVTMYHGVSDNGFDNPELYVRPSTMREQIEWLLDNGCDPIFFEDLWHLEDYDKPILLTYDDGYSCMYTDLFPILQEYQVKATIFLVTDDVYNSEKCLNWDQVREMQDSGLVSFQSHTVTHPHLSQISREEQEKELADSRLVIARELGKEPFALAYPYGDVNGDTYEVTPSWYRFAVRMSNPMGMKLDVYVTGQNPVEIYRFYVPRSITLERFASRLVW